MTMAFAMAHPFLDQVYKDRCASLVDILPYHLPMEDINTVVDMGCGSGQIGLAFERMGKSVIFIDGRWEHLEELSKDGRVVWVWDAHKSSGIKADLVLCMGLLYHSAHPQQILQHCAEIAPRIVVETVSLDWDESVCIIEEEISQRHDQSLTGWGSYHSPSWIEQTLRDVGYPDIVDISNTVPDAEASETHTGHIYNWKTMNDGTRHRDGYALRKLWVASKDA